MAPRLPTSLRKWCRPRSPPPSGLCTSAPSASCSNRSRPRSPPCSTAPPALLARGPRLVVVTLGADGAFGVGAEAEVQVAAPLVDVVDTIGAGDAFGAALLVWLHDHARLRRDLNLSREELRLALEFACLVASITCTRRGANPPRRAELDPYSAC